MTREGSLIFFFQFLQAGGRWDQLLEALPLAYKSNNASDPKDIIGTIFLGVLCGHWRYVHLNSIRGDGVNPGLLGMGQTVSEDTVRRGLKKMDRTAGLDWLRDYQIDTLGPRLCLGGDVKPGKKHAAKEGLPGLWAILEKLPRTHWPHMIRSD